MKNTVERVLSGASHGISVNLSNLQEKALRGLNNVNSASERDIVNYLTSICSSSMLYEPELDRLAMRLQLNLLCENTPDKFSDAVRVLYDDNEISKECWEFVENNREALDVMIDESMDESLSFHGIETLKKSYLLRDKSGAIVERPQYMYLRVAIGVTSNNLNDIELTYGLLSRGYYIHATPTLYSAATNNPQLASCFLISMESSEPMSVLKTIDETVRILHNNGGVGLHVSKVGSITKNSTRGLVSVTRVFNNLVKYCHDLANRPSAITMYLEPWHNDVFDFLDFRKNNGAEELRARDIFFALWIPDLFMERVASNGEWSLMCPQQSPGLDEVYSDEFKELYLHYEKTGKYIRKVKARELWRYICLSQIETGNPSMLFKDAANEKSNHKHLGTIKGSNLCTEIIQYAESNENETAVCNLASIALPKFVDEEGRRFDFDELKFVTKIVLRNLNNLIDKMKYPTEASEKSNKRHRPVGIGVQGLADVFMLMKIPYCSKEAKRLNIQIFEAIYYAALEESCHWAMLDGAYDSYVNSPVYNGELQFDMWNENVPADDRLQCDWNYLRAIIKQHGLRNSLTTTAMPTASTAQILGNTESFEPITFTDNEKRRAYFEKYPQGKTGDLFRWAIPNYTHAQNLVYGTVAQMCNWPLFDVNGKFPLVDKKEFELIEKMTIGKCVDNIKHISNGSIRLLYEYVHENYKDLDYEYSKNAGIFK